jgi:hypothetical protein
VQQGFTAEDAEEMAALPTAFADDLLQQRRLHIPGRRRRHPTALAPEITAIRDGYHHERRKLRPPLESAIETPHGMDALEAERRSLQQRPW